MIVRSEHLSEDQAFELIFKVIEKQSFNLLLRVAQESISILIRKEREIEEQLHNLLKHKE